MGLKVRATKLGYYGHERRFEGDVFELVPLKIKRQDKSGVLKEISLTPEQQFSSKWMEKVDGEVTEAPKKEKKVQVQVKPEQEPV